LHQSPDLSIANLSVFVDEVAHLLPNRGAVLVEEENSHSFVRDSWTSQVKRRIQPCFSHCAKHHPHPFACIEIRGQRKFSKMVDEDRIPGVSANPTDVADSYRAYQEPRAFDLDPV
jgi:hypothetical protein